MGKFLSGVLVGALATVIVVCYCFPHSHDGPGSGSDDPHRHKLMTEIFPALAPPKEDRKFRGISGSARFDEQSHLVVHDLHNGTYEDQINRNRLGLVETDAYSPYIYRALNIASNEWRGDSVRVANDLEAACKLSERPGAKKGERTIDYLVAESGRVDIWNGGTPILQPWQGRIFHVTINVDAAGVPVARVLQTPRLVLASVTPPAAPSASEKFSHSKENYEGMACLGLKTGEGSTSRYLVVLGERGEGNGPGTIYWGEYDTSVPDADKEVDWSADTLSDIRAPFHADTSTQNWRDITGLYIDEDRQLFATAAFDTDEGLPPFQSVAYQLGIICLGNEASNEDCKGYKETRPVALANKNIVAASVYYKFESVAGSVGKSPSEKALSLASEDEDMGGTWWPAVRK